MGKKFDEWNTVKKSIESLEPRSVQKHKMFFHEREIWWARIGENIGFETCGKGAQYARPVLILKKFSLDSALIVPLTTQIRESKYTISIGLFDKKPSYVNISQVRLVDTRRFTNKIGVCSIAVFKEIKETVRACVL